MKDEVNLRKWRKYGHRTRRRRLTSAAVLGRLELAEMLDCPPELVEQTLIERGTPYHKDSTGEIWTSAVSLLQPPTV